MNDKKLKVYLINEGIEGYEFAVIWNNAEEILKYLKETFAESRDDTIDMITEISDKEIIEWGFGWSFDKGTTILNGLESIQYIYENELMPKEPLVS